VIQVDPSRAQKELRWAPSQGLEVFLKEMFEVRQRDRSIRNAEA
jgi:hypothetical protein